MQPRRRTRPGAYATLAVLLGFGSVVTALAAPHDGDVQTGFFASSTGILAIVTGVRTVRVASRSARGGRGARAFGRCGAVLGGTGTALMLYAVIAFGMAHAGVHLPALALPVGGSSTTNVPVLAPASEPRAAVPDPAASATAAAPDRVVGDAVATVEQERLAVAQSAGTLASVLQQRFGTGPFPPQLAVDRTAPERVMLLDGSSLAPIPAGARVRYSVASDGSSWSVTVVGSAFGAVATYDSAVGTVQVG